VYEYIFSEITIGLKAMLSVSISRTSLRQTHNGAKMSTGQETVLFCREGNRRSGVALAMHHRLCNMSIYGLDGLIKEDEHPASSKEYGILYLFTVQQSSYVYFHRVISSCRVHSSKLHCNVYSNSCLIMSCIRHLYTLQNTVRPVAV